MVINPIGSGTKMNSESRYETKYRINYSTYFAIKNAIPSYLRPDLHTKCSAQKRYLVRSLYFDTRDYRFYSEKIHGVSNRIKFRIRTYGSHPADLPDIRVEMKVRIGKLMEKHGAFVTYPEYLRFMKFGIWDSCQDPVLSEFTRYVHKWNLEPKTLVQYYREGYESRSTEKIRLTFDHKISSSSSHVLFPEVIHWRQHRESQVDLEIKHQNEFPYWMSKIIQYYSLKIIPNSKYSNSIEVATKDLFLAS